MTQLRNTSSHYGWASILLHWLMAFVVFGLFGLGLYMVDLSYYDAWYKDALDLHKSIGLSLAALYLLRLLWRLGNTTPQPLGTKTWEITLAHWAHRLLYLLLLVLMASGYLISTADGRSIAVFGLFDVAALPWAIEQQEEIAGQIHEWLAWTLMGLVFLHAVAALKHHCIDKDNTLKRMLHPQRPQ